MKVRSSVIGCCVFEWIWLEALRAQLARITAVVWVAHAYALRVMRIDAHACATAVEATGDGGAVVRGGGVTQVDRLAYCLLPLGRTKPQPPPVKVFVHPLARCVAC